MHLLLNSAIIPTINVTKSFTLIYTGESKNRIQKPVQTDAKMECKYRIKNLPACQKEWLEWPWATVNLIWYWTRLVEVYFAIDWIYINIWWKFKQSVLLKWVHWIDFSSSTREFWTDKTEDSSIYVKIKLDKSY